MTIPAAHESIETVGCIQTIQTTAASSTSTESGNSSSTATVTSIIVVRDESTDTADSERTPIRQQIIKFDTQSQQQQHDHVVHQLLEQHEQEQEDDAIVVEQHGVDILEDAIETSSVGATSVVVETARAESVSAGSTFDEFDALGLAPAASAAAAASTAGGSATGASRSGGAGAAAESGVCASSESTTASGSSMGASAAAAAAAAAELNQDSLMMYTLPADDWKAHMTRKEREFVCRLCPYIAQYQHHYVGHFYTHHATTKPHQCGLCFKTFPLASTLKRHVATVHVAVKFACDICGKVFPRRDSFNFHVKTHLSRQTDTN